MFVHGGVLPQHVEHGLERINQETRQWMLGESQRVPSFLVGRQAIVWAREYSAGKPAQQRQCLDSLSRFVGSLCSVWAVC
jgi:hypothetical protein